MDIKKHLNSTKIYQELDDKNREYWFDFKQKKFLHNIDTFYYLCEISGGLYKWLIWWFRSQVS